MERGSLARIANSIPLATGKLFVVTEEAVWKLFSEQMQTALGGRNFELLFLPGSESSKRFVEVERLAEQMSAAGADRTSLVIAFGGGIVNDMAGFLAAIFMRGIPVIQAPTTLLAQVDAAIGGKTGVNLQSGKNLLGSFHQPAAVIIDPLLLKTLPERDYRAGLYEVIKYGVIGSPGLFKTLLNRSEAVLRQLPDVLDQIVTESVRMKAEVVSADERESDLRRILNFGHTAGHALESETLYQRFLHGEAVGFGIDAATRLAFRLGMLPAETANEILHVIGLYGPIPSLDGITVQSLVSRLTKDKKTVQGDTHWVLPDSIGHVQIRRGVPPADVSAAIQAALVGEPLHS